MSKVDIAVRASVVIILAMCLAAASFALGGSVIDLVVAQVRCETNEVSCHLVWEPSP